MEGVGEMGELGLDPQKPHHALDLVGGRRGELRAGYPITVEAGEDRSSRRWSDASAVVLRRYRHRYWY
jgi:hypothetical protein